MCIKLAVCQNDFVTVPIGSVILEFLSLKLLSVNNQYPQKLQNKQFKIEIVIF